jgi:RNA polymerase sigma factor (sigma-70 family)
VGAINNRRALLVVLIVPGLQRRIAELEALYRDRFPAFARVAISVTGSVDVGREVVQEAFACSIEDVDRFRGECSLEAWVWRIEINTAKTAARRGAFESGEPTVLPEIATNGHREVSAVQLWVRTLPERQRLVVFLRYWADLDYRSIATALGIEVGTVSATLSAAHRALRQSLQEVPK